MPRAGTLSKTRRWRTQSRRPCVRLFLYRVRETGRDYLRNPVNHIHIPSLAMSRKYVYKCFENVIFSTVFDYICIIETENNLN